MSPRKLGGVRFSSSIVCSGYYRTRFIGSFVIGSSCIFCVSKLRRCAIRAGVFCTLRGRRMLWACFFGTCVVGSYRFRTTR